MNRNIDANLSRHHISGYMACCRCASFDVVGEVKRRQGEMKSDRFNNKRIAKNTILLYIRQILTMVVSLYTSRVVLNALGVDDYGIYNVVGGVVLMFAFLNSTMASASQRFLAYDIAQGNEQRLKQTFGLTFLSYIIVAVIAIVLCESVAVWFLNTKLNIPADRMEAANWVLQCSIFMFVLNILTTPFLSAIIARERMGVYAYASIVDALLKLIAVYILTVIPSDKMKAYGLLMLAVTFSMTVFYTIYCRGRFCECKCLYYYEKRRLREMFSFAGWNVLGSIANITRSQGINIVLNIFFNPAVNAARGIAYHVNSAIASFSNNFYTAVRPQIIKTFAVKEYEQMFNIIFYSSRLAYYLLFIISLPVLLLTDELLTYWLVNPPELSVLFVQLTIVNSLIEVLNYPLVNGLQACGKIRGYQIFISISYLMVLPIAFYLYKLGYPPETAMVVNIIIVAACSIPRLLFCRKYIGLNILEYCKKVIGRIFIVTICGYYFGCYISSFEIISKGWSFIFKALSILLVSTMIILLLGITRIEKANIYKLFKSKIIK